MKNILDYILSEGFRTLGDYENPLYCAVDVCKFLGHKNVAGTLRRLSKEDQSLHVVQTNGGPQQLVFITESALYELIFTSRTAEARVFQAWVFDNVLPKSGALEHLLKP